MKRNVTFWLSAFPFFLIVAGCAGPGSNGHGFCHTEGNRIVDDMGHSVQFKGISWFGFETSDRVPHGLWKRSMDSQLAQMHSLGFNLLRVPWSDDIFKPLEPGKALRIDFQENSDLQNLTPLEILDKLVEKAGRHSIRILLDRHRPDSRAQSEFWYTTNVSEQVWIEHWVTLAQRYRTNPTVIGADLHNEPHGKTTWGSGNEQTDWRLAAERAGNAILSVQPNWLIVVEGIERVGSNSYWWGGNLMGAAEYPVRLSIPQRVVYSPRDYGPSVWKQRWFSAPDFPANLKPIWDQHWGYIQRKGLAPVMVGEFGADAVDPERETVPIRKIEAVWQNALVDYIRSNQMSWIYWCWNPESGDTGGILLNDWQTVNEPKMKILRRLMN